jgi:hypothetical protein
LQSSGALDRTARFQQLTQPKLKARHGVCTRRPLYALESGSHVADAGDQAAVALDDVRCQRDLT